MVRVGAAYGAAVGGQGGQGAVEAGAQGEGGPLGSELGARLQDFAPLVLVVYGAVVISGAALVLSGPGPAGWLALGVTAAALAVTAFAAAPTHGRLADRDDALVTRLLVADRWRCAFAVGGAVLAVVAVVVAP